MLWSIYTGQASWSSAARHCLFATGNWQPQSRLYPDIPYL